MKRPPLFPGFDKNKWGSFEIAAGYFLLGVLWILFSDKIAARLSPTTEALSQISIYKGWGYVLVTAILLYWLIQRYAKNIQETNERYKLIAENSSDVIWLLDPAQGRFKYVSPSILKLRGYTAEEVMAMPVNDALLPVEVERLTALSTERISMLQSKGSGVMSFTDEIDQPHRDGSIIPTEVTTTYWFNDAERDRGHGCAAGYHPAQTGRKEITREREKIPGTPRPGFGWDLRPAKPRRTRTQAIW